jgi:hypothetical protein
MCNDDTSDSNGLSTADEKGLCWPMLSAPAAAATPAAIIAVPGPMFSSDVDLMLSDECKCSLLTVFRMCLPTNASCCLPQTSRPGGAVGFILDVHDDGVEIRRYVPSAPLV